MRAWRGSKRNNVQKRKHDERRLRVYVISRCHMHHAHDVIYQSYCWSLKNVLLQYVLCDEVARWSSTTKVHWCSLQKDVIQCVRHNVLRLLYLKWNEVMTYASRVLIMSIWSILRRRNIRFNRRLHRRNKRKQFRYPDYRLLFRLRTISCTKMQDAEVLSQSVDQAAKSRALTEARIKAAEVRDLELWCDICCAGSLVATAKAGNA